MGRRCGCAGGDCSCAITRGRGIEFEGNGSQSTPLIISTNPDAHAFMQGRSSSNSTVNINGNGTIDTPYAISLGLIPGVSIPLRDEAYLSAGTYEWLRPPGSTMVEVVVIGGGAGGQAGGSQDAGPIFAAVGGSGGSGGAWSRARMVLDVSIVRAVVTVGEGGNGGVAVVTPTGVFYPSGNDGGTTRVRFYTTTGEVPNLSVMAQGGFAALGNPNATEGREALGTRNGQRQFIRTGSIPAMRTPGGASGGGGGQSNSVPPNGMPYDGGTHSFYDPATTLMRVGGDGGNGGYGGLDGANGLPGEDGKGPGGGGGGGGGRGINNTGTLNKGGNGGKGGPGAAWITSF